MEKIIIITGFLILLTIGIVSGSQCDLRRYHAAWAQEVKRLGRTDGQLPPEQAERLWARYGCK